jgi:hypothetical protein
MSKEFKFNTNVMNFPDIKTAKVFRNFSATIHSAEINATYYESTVIFIKKNKNIFILKNPITKKKKKFHLPAPPIFNLKI